MGKRSVGKFPRRAADLYQTWNPRAVEPLLPFLAPGTRFVEPCAGEGHLIELLEAAGHHCVGAFDIHLWPKRTQFVHRADARTLNLERRVIAHRTDKIITNPPWTRNLKIAPGQYEAVLHPIILNLCRQRPTFLLFDADWAFTIQAPPVLRYCWKIIAIGRLCWFKGTTTGNDNAAWYFFDRAPRPPGVNIEFIERR